MALRLQEIGWGLFLTLLLLFCFSLSGGESFAQAPIFVNGFPTQSGIVLLGSDGSTRNFYPVTNFPNDVALLPSQTEFAVVTAPGEFIIFNGSGEQLYQVNFESLEDVDVLAEPERFLFTSRYGQRIFLFDRESGTRQNIEVEVQGPTDTDLLPNGNYLICDAQASRVFEITPDGQVVWSYDQGLLQPMDALRLPNGNTLISDFDNHRVIEVSPGLTVVSEQHGFNHPIKLTLLPNGDYLVADGDNQRLVRVNAQGQQSIVRERMNYIKSAAFLESMGLYLCVVQNRFDPPQVENQAEPPLVNPAAMAKPEPPALSQRVRDLLANPLFLLSLAAVLWGLSLFSHRFSPYLCLLIAYTLVLGVAYHYQTLASRAGDHIPQVWFWLAVFLLFLFTYRDAQTAFFPRERWTFIDSHPHFPFSFSMTFAFLAGAFALIFLQAGYLKPDLAGWLWRIPLTVGWVALVFYIVRTAWAAWMKILTIPISLVLFLWLFIKTPVLLGGWPWYIPMIAWFAALYFFLKILFPGWRAVSQWAAMDERSLGLNRPFTTGSVSESWEEDEEYSSEEYSPYVNQPFRLPARWPRYALLAILILSACFYIVNATQIPTDVHGDEGEVALHGLQVRDSGNWNFFNLGWYQIPHLFYLIPAWVMWLFGDNLFGMRIAGAIVGIASVALFYLLARRILYTAPAVLATFLFATSTYFVHFSRIGIGYNQTTLLTLAALYFLVRGVQDSDGRNLCLAGMAAAFGFLSYQATHLLAPMIIASLLLLWILRAIRLRQLFLYTASFLLALFLTISPLLGTYWVAPQASVSRAQSVTLLSEEGRNLILSEYPGVQSIDEVFKQQIIRSLLAPISYEDRSPYLKNHNYGGLLDPLPAVFFTAGIMMLALMAVLRWNPIAILLLFWTLATLMLGSALTNHVPSYQRLTGLIPFLLLIAAPVLHGVLLHLTRVGHWTPFKRTCVTSIMLVLLLVLGMHRYFHQIMAVPQWLDEWTRVARVIKEAGPTTYIYFLGPPRVYFGYGTTRFLAPEAKGENVEVPDVFLKQKIYRRGPVMFMLIGNNRHYIHELRSLYPGGREENWHNSQGGDPFTTYTVDF